MKRQFAPRQCKVCNAEFVPKSHNPHQLYCSTQCYHKQSTIDAKGRKIQLRRVIVCGVKNVENRDPIHLEDVGRELLIRERERLARKLGIPTNHPFVTASHVKRMGCEAYARRHGITLAEAIEKLDGPQMKLILCPECHDMRKISKARTECKCGKSWGRYLDDGHHAEMGGRAIPIGISNKSLTVAIKNRKLDGCGTRFDAFVTPYSCKTVIVEENL